MTSLPSNVRFGDMALSMSAGVGDPSTSQLPVEDPLGLYDFKGLRAFETRETSAPSNNQIILRGVVQDREVGRSAERALLTGVERLWTIDIQDYNWHLFKRVLVDDDSNRPAESIGDRLRWLINRAAHVNINDYGNVFYPSRQMDANDYRTQRPIDVLNDCCIEDNYSFWCDYNEAHGKPELFFIRPASDDYASAVAVSNLYADADGVTVFFPYRDAKLGRSASRIAFGALVTHADGYEYRRKDSTGEQFGKLDQVAPMSNVKTAARAGRLAQKFVNDNDEETDVINLQLNVPAAQVNDIRHGHRLNVKFQHLPGYEDYVGMRVLRRTVIQEAAIGEDRYVLDLELTGPVGGDDPGGGGGGNEPQATAGAVLYEPQDPNTPGTTIAVTFRNDGDTPSAGYPTRPRDADAFAYTGTGPDYTGFEVLATSGTLNVHLKFSFLNISVSNPHTYTGELLLNGVVIGSSSAVKTGSTPRADSSMFDITVTGVAVVAGDLLTARMTTSVLSGVTIPLAAGDNTLLFEILASSVVVL